MHSIWRVAAVCSVLAICMIANAQEATKDVGTKEKVTRMAAKALFKRLIGKWEGPCQTFLEPGEPGKVSDESVVTGEFTEVLGGRFLRHTYKGAILGKPRHGEEMIAFNSITKKYQSSWVDDFHTAAAIMFSEGGPMEHGFSVRCEYAYDADKPKWGWRTEFELIDDDHLTITAYNIKPNGQEAKGVQTKYHRVK